MPQQADRSRFRLALPYERVRDVSVKMVGLGNIGSHTALALGQLGVPQFYLIDPEEVGDENVMTQAFDNTHVGWDKVEAVKSLLQKINPNLGGDEPHIERVMRGDVERIEDSAYLDQFANITVVGTDNIESRRRVYAQMLDRAKRALGILTPPSKRVTLLVDARMVFDFLEVFFVLVGKDGAKEASYVAGLSEKDYVKAGCGASSASYAGKAVAGIISSGVRQFLVGRKIPFHVSLDLSNFEMHREWRDGEKFVEEEFAVTSVA